MLPPPPPVLWEHCQCDISLRGPSGDETEGLQPPQRHTVQSCHLPRGQLAAPLK